MSAMCREGGIHKIFVNFPRSIFSISTHQYFLDFSYGFSASNSHARGREEENRPPPLLNKVLFHPALFVNRQKKKREKLAGEIQSLPTFSSPFFPIWKQPLRLTLFQKNRTTATWCSRQKDLKLLPVSATTPPPLSTNFPKKERLLLQNGHFLLLLCRGLNIDWRRRGGDRIKKREGGKDGAESAPPPPNGTSQGNAPTPLESRKGDYACFATSRKKDVMLFLKNVWYEYM